MTKTLHVGDRSPRVAEVRATLARLGMLADYDGDITSSKDANFTDADTFFDEHLGQALQGFQQSRGIIASGQIDDATLRVLREASYTLGARILSYEPSNILIGDDVTQLQL